MIYGYDRDSTDDQSFDAWEKRQSAFEPSAK
jgi:hypothetical protein